MAKDEWHRWGQTAVICGGILLAAGGYLQVQKEVCKDVTENKKSITKERDERITADQNLAERLRGLEINQTKIVALSESINGKLFSISTEQKANGGAIRSIQVDIATMKGHIATLETAE